MFANVSVAGGISDRGEARVTRFGERTLESGRQAQRLRRSRLLAPEVRRAAARMAIAATESNGEKTGPRVVAVAVAEGWD